MIEIHEVDTADGSRLREWYDVWAAAQEHRPDAMVPSWKAAGEPLMTPHPRFAFELFEARDDGVPAGAGFVNLPLEDNLTVCYVDVMVHPDHRRRGVGSAVLAEVERRARSAGRERVLGEVYLQPDDDPRDIRFAEAHGYGLANREGVKALDLALSEPSWGPLEQESAAALGDYRIVTWRDRCPDDLVESFGAALSRVMSLIPQGELDLEDSDWSVEHLREVEERRIAIGLANFESAAVCAGGTVVGLTGVRASIRDPRVAHVGVTMVLPEHRGHRLGLAVKLASHRALRQDVPDCELVVTSNADVNLHMNAINEALGYRQLETLLEYQKRL